ncbi:MAG: DUF4328 domain-containing protein [Jatrophihabitans sp.]|uniref:DUF4328 domain-containing protein n=1 Tax=Jatrophihabitans sp. TaxID=1932789 RepID=UPI003F7D30C7
MEPGWYPDPFSNGVRWWDGRAWSSYTAPSAPSFYRLDPRKDLDDEHVAAGRASIAVVLAALIGAVNQFVAAAVFGDFFRKSLDATTNADGTVTEPAMPSGFAFTELIGIAVFVAEIFLMIWLYRAAKFARNAALPARRDPVWAALGFFVPIVSFWFPYQVAADAFPRADRNRGLAGWWWTWYLISSLFVIVVVIAAGFSTTAGVVAAVIGAGAYALAAVYARRMIMAIATAHEQLLAAFSSQ